ncbi:MAG: hypothetical protein ACR2OZ_16945 [Verrucomicrobiales bacterium]
MKPQILLNCAWVLIAAGAYFVGTHRPRAVQDSASRTSVSAAPVFPTRPAAPVLQKEDPKTGIAAETLEAVRWLDSFRGTDGAISAERMKEAVQTALRDTDPVKSMFYFTQLLREMTAENGAAILQAINESVGGSESMRYLNLLAHAWGEKDGIGAMAALDAIRGRDLGGAKSTALAAWAARDPEAALKWLHDRNAARDPKSDPRHWVLSRGIVSGLARRDLDVALNYVMNLPQGQRGDFAGVLAEQKMKESVASAAEWALELPDERMRTNAMETIGYQYIRENLTGAMQWAEKIAARPDAHEAVADVANEMANRNGQEAAAWVAKLPAGPSQNHAFEDVFENWTRADPLAASQSLATMNSGPGRDTAIQAFSRTLARENPTDALAWANAITDPKTKVDVQIDIARRWQASAPNDAQAWIAANLPPELQARALAPRR